MLPESLPEIFLDTDVAFDIISKREPHFESSVQFLHLASQSKARLLLSESSLGNLFYLAFDIYKLKNSKSRMFDFIDVCELVPSGKMAVLKSLESSFKDKEDGLQYYTALNREVDYFITRNIKDYRKHEQSSLPVYSPIEFFDLINKPKGD